MRLGQHLAQHGQRHITLAALSKGTQAQAGAVGINTAPHDRPEIGKLFGNFAFIALASAQIERRPGQRGESRLAGRIEHRARSKIDLHINDGQRRRRNEIDTTALRGRPVFDLHAGDSKRSGEVAKNQQAKAGKYFFHDVTRFLPDQAQWRTATAGRRGLPSRG